MINDDLHVSYRDSIRQVYHPPGIVMPKISCRGSDGVVIYSIACNSVAVGRAALSSRLESGKIFKTWKISITYWYDGKQWCHSNMLLHKCRQNNIYNPSMCIWMNLSQCNFFTCDEDTHKHQVKQEQCTEKLRNDRRHCGCDESFHCISLHWIYKVIYSERNHPSVD